MNWIKGSFLAAFLATAAPVALAQAPAAPVSVAQNTDANVDRAVAVGNRYGSSQAAFLQAMGILNSIQRQQVADKLMRLNPHHFMDLVYPREGGTPQYTEEFLRALPLNPEFIFVMEQVVDLPFSKEHLRAARRHPNFEGGLQGKPIVSQMAVVEMNQLHSSGDAERFAVINDFSAGALFDVITQGRNDIYTSTYNGILNRMSTRMRASGQSFFDLIRAYPGREQRLPIFLEAAATFDRTGDLWKQLRPEEKSQLIDFIFHKVSNGNNNAENYSYSYLYAAADFIRSLPASDPSHALIEQRLREGFEKKPNTYGVLARWYAEMSAHVPSAVNQAFFERIRAEPRYQLVRPNTNSGSNFDAQGRNFQIHIFYNDSDGKSSYNAFLNRLNGDGWSCTALETTLPNCRKSNAGRSITIFISKPELDGDGVDEIKAHIASLRGKATVLVQRGHSYHVAHAIKSLDPNINIAFFGACGTSMVIEDITAKFSGLHIAASAGPGRGVINNASIIYMNNQLLRTGSMSWSGMKQQWQGIEGGSEYFTPADNAVQVLYNTYMQLGARAPALTPHVAAPEAAY